MNAPLLLIRHLHKQFAQAPAQSTQPAQSARPPQPPQPPLLALSDLAIEQAASYVLTGINGAGKSTLLRILAGLEPAERLECQWLGQNLPPGGPWPRPVRDAIIYVHQHPVMFSTSVEQNIGYGLRVRGQFSAALVQQALDWAGVGHLAHRLATTLSGGEKQRVALARAKILQPKLLLLDEPTSNLDGAAREQVIALIPQLLQGGSSVIMACHDRDLIGLPGMVRLKLRDGKIEIRANPATACV